MSSTNGNGSGTATAPSGWGAATRTATVSGRGQYDPKRFYTSATDAKGHYRTVSVSVPPELQGQINDLIASPDWPDYTNTQSFIRDAIVHLLALRASQADDPQVRQNIAEVADWIDLEEAGRRRRLRREQWERVKEDFEINAEQVVKGKDWSGLVEMIEEYVDKIDAIHDPYHSEGVALLARYRAAVPAEFRPPHW